MAGLVVVALAATGCGGGDGGGPQTEQGAVAAVERAQRGLLKGDADAVLGFLNAECRATVDADEIRLGLALVKAFLGDELDLDEIDVNVSIESFAGDTAEVRVEYVAPEGADLEEFGFDAETVEVFYEGDKWVADDCDFGDDSELDANELEAALADAGLAATRDDPVPLGVAAPVGGGFTVSIDSIDTDAAAVVDEGGGYVGEPEPGSQLVLIGVTLGYAGSEEPASVSGVSFTAVGGASAVGVDIYGCSGFDGELNTMSALFNGGVVSGYLCGEVPASDIDGMVLNVGRSFADRTVFFDPFDTGAAPVAVVGASGPQPDGDLTSDRDDPIPVGTPTDVGEGWTLTVNGVDPDAAGTLAANEYNEPAPDGSDFVLIDMTLAYDGDDSASGSFVDLDVVGDSNVAIGAGSCWVTWDGELDRFSEVFSGGSLSGQVCFLVAAADVGSLQLLASAAFGDEPLVFAID